GEVVDIYVAVRDSNNELLKVFIEVKGSWNRELKESLNDQLVDRYLADNKCTQGIYVVGNYLCDLWDKEDYRYKDTKRILADGDLEKLLSDEAKRLSFEKNLDVQVIFLDLTLK
ncbi:hypothetical protein MJH12_05480, partial [bacterium]|nr:hypothetical protein [bacterium]